MEEKDLALGRGRKAPGNGDRFGDRDICAQFILTGFAYLAAYGEKRLLEVFDDYSVAEAFGRSRFDDGLFSIQEVTQEPLDIRWFKYASDDGAIRSDRREAHRS